MGRQGKIMLDVPSGTLAAMAVLGMAFLLGGGAGCLLGGMVNGAGGSARNMVVRHSSPSRSLGTGLKVCS